MYLLRQGLASKTKDSPTTDRLQLACIRIYWPYSMGVKMVDIFTVLTHAFLKTWIRTGQCDREYILILTSSMHSIIDHRIWHQEVVRCVNYMSKVRHHSSCTLLQYIYIMRNMAINQQHKRTNRWCMLSQNVQIWDTKGIRSYLHSKLSISYRILFQTFLATSRCSSKLLLRRTNGKLRMSMEKSMPPGRLSTNRVILPSLSSNCLTISPICSLRYVHVQFWTCLKPSLPAYVLISHTLSL